jgi:lipopolysaccharide biosynthesis glycosyltransferase
VAVQAGCITLVVGYDPRESVAYHVLCQSVMERTSVPVQFIPLHVPMLGDFDGQQDGTNAFIYSRFLIPELMGFDGWAIYCDSDMLLRADLKELWDLRDDSKAVMVCKHDYKTRHAYKSIGTVLESRNEDYPRKNWSSLVMWNCSHQSNRIVKRSFAAMAGGRALHRFTWLNDEEIGSLPLEWNWLVGEYPYEKHAKLVHFTLGMPGFDHYRNCDYAGEWRSYLNEVERRDCLKISRMANHV